jgi:hypothetical protein
MRQDRQAIEETVNELNLEIAERAIFIRPLQWERDALPMIAEYPQDAVNTQLLAKADILCAVLGTRVGTPTRHYKSGTIEEITKFIEQSAKPFGGHEVQIYFKRERVDPLSLDLDQLNEVARFRSWLSTKGVLFRDYTDANELKSFVRRSILACINYGHSGPRDVAQTDPQASPSDHHADDETEEGYFDLQDTFQAKFDRTNEILAHVNSALSEMTSKLINIRSIVETTGGIGIDMRSVFDDATEAIDEAAERIKPKCAEVQRNFSDALSALSRYTEMSIEFGAASTSDVNALIQQIDVAVSSARDTHNQIDDLYQTVASLPNFSKRFRRASRNLAESLQGLLEFVAVSIQRMEHLRTELANRPRDV